MTQSVEEKRRELFEADCRRKNMPFLSRSTAPGYAHEYQDHVYQARWLGFNAALDLVDIKMPSSSDAMKTVFDYQNNKNTNVTGTTNWAANIGMVVVEECRDAINQTGLGLKVSE